MFTLIIIATTGAALLLLSQQLSQQLSDQLSNLLPGLPRSNDDLVFV